jgi:hypothetical protein
MNTCTYLQSARAYAGAASSLLDIAVSLNEPPSEDNLRSISKALSRALEETMAEIPYTSPNPPQESPLHAQNIRGLLNEAYESLLDIEGGLSPLIKLAYFHEEDDSELSGLGPLLNMIRIRAFYTMNKIVVGLDNVNAMKGGIPE